MSQATDTGFRGKGEGFTLIELLVTLMLMTITVALVAPNLFNTLAGIEQKSVVKEVAQDVSWLRNQAFLQEHRLEVTLEEAGITAHRLLPGGEKIPEPYFQKAYPLLSFPEQTFRISANGNADMAQIQLELDGVPRVIEVGSW